jgi:hypothetical protein
MKTVLQELIENLESNIKGCEIALIDTIDKEFVKGTKRALEDVKIDLENLLEKEKEQIVDACNANLKGLLTNGKDYYDLNFNHQEVTSDTPSNYQRGWNAAQRGLLQNDAWGDTYTDNANNRPSHEELDEWIKGWKAYRYSNEIAKNK